MDYLLQSFPLAEEEVSFEYLSHHYGVEEAHSMISVVPTAFLRCMTIPGVASRHQLFAASLSSNHDDDCDDDDDDDGMPTPLEAIASFSAMLGHVTTYRALALTTEQYEAMLHADKMVSPGGLRADKQQLQQALALMGCRKACQHRLFPMSRPRGYIDPTYSVYDDPETTLIISSGYVRPGTRIYLFELRMPLIETFGKPISHFHDDDKKPDAGEQRRWFQHRSVWFDADASHTERFCFFEVPQLSQRVVSVSSFDPEEIEGLISNFRVLQHSRKTTQLYAIRHGHTEYAQGNRRHSDVENVQDLTDRGIAQVIESTRVLCEKLNADTRCPQSVIIRSSPTARCLHTTRLVRDTLLADELFPSVTIIIDERLEEIGQFSWEPFKQCLDALQLDSRNPSLCNKIYHDGLLTARRSELPHQHLREFVDELEPGSSVRDRVRAACLDSSKIDPADISVVVTHDGCLSPYAESGSVARGALIRLLDSGSTFTEDKQW